MSEWHLYLIEIKDGQLYTGITTDVDRRVNEHQNDTASPNAAKQGLDDLTIINGIGDVLQDRLRNLGFSTYEQLAELSETEKEMIEDTLDFKGRIDRDHWKTQARHQKAIKELASS